MALGRAVTMGRWRYIEWEDGRSGRELYDHQSDPWEKVNLAERPEHQELMEDLRELFSDLVRADSPEAVVKRRL
jgi:arylsulfatase A-like enzyme